MPEQQMADETVYVPPVRQHDFSTDTTDRQEERSHLCVMSCPHKQMNCFLPSPSLFCLSQFEFPHQNTFRLGNVESVKIQHFWRVLRHLVTQFQIPVRENRLRRFVMTFLHLLTIHTSLHPELSRQGLVSRHVRLRCL